VKKYASEIKRLVASGATINDLGRFAAGMSIEKVTGSASAVFYRSQDTRFLLVGGAGNVPDSLATLEVKAGSDGVLARVAREMKPVLILPEESGDLLSPSLRDFAGHSCIVVPICSGDRCDGLMFVASSDDVNPYRKRHVEYLADMAGELSMAFEVVRLRAQLADGRQLLVTQSENRKRELAALHEIANEVGLADDVQDLFGFVFETLKKIVPFSAAVAIVYTGRVQRVYVCPHNPTKVGVADAANHAFSVLEKTTGRKAKRRATDIFSVVPLDKKLEESKTEFAEHLCVPVVAADKIRGAMILLREERHLFDDDDIVLLGAASKGVIAFAKQMLAKRRTQMRSMRSVLGSMLEGILMVDKNMRFEVMNPAGENLLSLCAPSSRGAHLDTLGSIDCRELLRPVLSGAKATVSREINAQNDPMRRVSISVAAVRSGSDRIKVAVVILRDVTQERNLQDQLAQAEKLSSIGQMISGVAHELNNPLTSVIGYS